MLHIKGIYFGSHHFASRIIGKDGTVWFHDGIVTAKNCIAEGCFDLLSPEQLMVCRGKSACAVINGKSV